MDFAKAYKINWRKSRKCKPNDTMEKCLARFPTLNSFFTRKIRPSFTKPSTTRPDALVCPADCFGRKLADASAGTFDIKGAQYNLETFLGRSDITRATVFIFRLAPQHYHRIHSPLQGTVQSIETVQGTYKSVDPILLDELPVLQENVRKIITFTNGIILVAIGATAVGSIRLSIRKGDSVVHGQDLGDFQLGGSCLTLILPAPLHLVKPNRRWTTNEKEYKVGDYVGRFAGRFADA
jgi:phosphatidylserine decarboxylase